MKLPFAISLFGAFSSPPRRTLTEKSSDDTICVKVEPDLERGQAGDRGHVKMHRKVTFDEECINSHANGMIAGIDNPPVPLEDYCSSPTSVDTRTSSEFGYASDNEHGFESGSEDPESDNETSSRAPRSPVARTAVIPKKINWITRIRHFIRQSDPDGAVEERIVNNRMTPILSGVIIPFSILLAIPGLTEHWYIRTVDNQTVEIRKNPVILDVGLALSMAAALLATVAIIIRFFERRVKTMTIIAIVMLTIHDVINTVAVTTFGVIHRFNDGFTYGESFWFTMCSTIASLFTNITLAYDLAVVPDFASSGSGLTRKQRSLVIVVIMLLSWIAIGALINGLLLRLSFIDGLYFTIVTVETIGFGDIKPESTGNRIFVIFHGTVCIVLLGLAVTTTRETVMEAFEMSYQKRLSALLEKRRARKAHRAEVHARRKAIKNQLRMAGLPVYATVLQVGPSSNQGDRHRHKRMHLNIGALSPQQLETALEEAQRIRNRHSLRVSIDSPLNPATPDLDILSANSSETSIIKYQKSIAHDQHREFTVKLTVVWSLFITFWLTGAAIFMHTEGWSFGEAMWFCFESFSTIGYGEISPVTPAGRSIFIVWALLGVGTMTILISVLVEASSSRYNTALEDRYR